MIDANPQPQQHPWSTTQHLEQQTFVRNVIIEINNVIMKIKWRQRAENQ